MAIKNHRRLKVHIDKSPLLASEAFSIKDVTNSSVLFNGKNVHILAEELEHPNNELLLKLACDEILKETSNIERQGYYREFLRLYLHYDGILGAGLSAIKQQLQQRGYGVRNSGVEHKVNVYLRKGSLHIEDEFFFRKFDVLCETALATRVEEDVRIFTPEPHDYLVYGKTQFELEVIKQHGIGVPRLVILQSILDCPDPYFRKMVDERSFLEKLIDFLKMIFRIATHTPVQSFTFFKPSVGNVTSSAGEAQSQRYLPSPCPN